MAVAGASQRSFALNLFLLFAILPITVLATARPMFNKERPCAEIYIVGKGETLQTISEKCNAPFILIDNPHIQDTDDIYEGLPLRLWRYLHPSALLLQQSLAKGAPTCSLPALTRMSLPPPIPSQSLPVCSPHLHHRG